jgi:hypothetical protein
MLKSEFEQMTGFAPTEDEYKEIERAYMKQPEEKHAFCRQFVESGGITRLVEERAKTIARMEKERDEEKAVHEKIVCALQAKNEELTKQLDKELQWKICEGAGTNFPEDRYQELLHAGSKVLSETEAKDLLFGEFGFAPEAVELISVVETYEVNKYHRMRGKDRFDRLALVNATDWNYIRFNVRGWQYEMINGTLILYNS